MDDNVKRAIGIYIFFIFRFVINLYQTRGGKWVQGCSLSLSQAEQKWCIISDVKPCRTIEENKAK